MEIISEKCAQHENSFINCDESKSCWIFMFVQQIASMRERKERSSELQRKCHVQNGIKCKQTNKQTHKQSKAKQTSEQTNRQSARPTKRRPADRQTDRWEGTDRTVDGNACLCVHQIENKLYVQVPQIEMGFIENVYTVFVAVTTPVVYINRSWMVKQQYLDISCGLPSS